MSTSSTISSTYSSHNRSSRWTSSKVKVMQVIKVDQLEDTNYERLTWAKLHSGLKPKNENVPKEDFWRKATFDRRWPLMEDDLWQKTTFDGRPPLTGDDLWRQTTFDGRRPWTEDDLWRKTTFDWQPPLTEDDLSIKCKFLYYLNKMTMTIHLDCYATTDCKPEVLSGVETGNRIPHDEWNLRGIAHMYTYTEKTTFLEALASLGMVMSVTQSVCLSVWESVCLSESLSVCHTFVSWLRDNSISSLFSNSGQSKVIVHSGSS